MGLQYNKTIIKKLFILLLLPVFLINCKKEKKQEITVFPKEKTINWMQDLIKKFPNKNITLKDISLPRAHDAGMYEINDCFGGNACNTKTQDNNMKTMLEYGIRVFDLRPSFKNGEFWTYHKTSCGGLGCDGIKLISFLEDTRDFLQEHNELVIFEIIPITL